MLHVSRGAEPGIEEVERLQRGAALRACEALMLVPNVQAQPAGLEVHSQLAGLSICCLSVPDDAIRE
jgi:hypothetical protein